VKYVIKKESALFHQAFLLVICPRRIMVNGSEVELGGEYAREKIE
jgi:hypothetical protein